VTVVIGGRKQARALVSQSSYYSHDDVRVHFGVGDAAHVDRIEVRWPSGSSQAVDTVARNQEVTIREETGPPVK
jgi:hypothetical protein